MMTRDDFFRSGSTIWEELGFYARFTWRFLVLHRPEPLL